MRWFSNYINFFCLSLFGLLLYSCSPLAGRISEKNYLRTFTPPGTVKIGKNLFCDKFELNNTNYREYLFWTDRVFGYSSKYKSALPDTMAWMKGYSCLYWFNKYYFRHPMYQDYPVEGISQKQARDFCKWRSDRVMEYLLVRLNKFKWDDNPDSNTYFSIEKYFSGHYHNLIPDTNIKYYPEYSLPSKDEFLKAVHYSDSVDVHEKHTFFQGDIVPCLGDSMKSAPTVIVSAGYRKAIWNLAGNVREWLSEDKTVMGGAWNEHIDKNYRFIPDSLSTDDAYTGFRNVCHWVKAMDKDKRSRLNKN